ncbi:MAG: right-handed parallel beta-helix repeat-containing protein, partial [Halobacteriales archaeon]|nr:right-handed parallel beta-helix repeat-containing protein [Halobacteriales archaeon]
TRDLFIQGESQAGVVLEAGAEDMFTLQQPDGTTEPVRLFLNDLTLDTTGTGVHLQSDTEANLTRVTCVEANPCALASDIFGLFPVAGGTLTLRDSLLTGSGAGNGLKILGGGHLIQNTTIENYDNGIDALVAGFQILGGAFTGNARGLQLEGTLDGSRVQVRDATFDDNGVGIFADDVPLTLNQVEITNSGTYGLDLLGDRESDLTDVTVTGSGNAGIRASGPLISVQGGAFNGNTFGLMIGSSTAVIERIEASGNSLTGLVIYGEANVTLRDSELRNNDRYNLNVRESPNGVDLGVPGDPGGNGPLAISKTPALRDWFCSTWSNPWAIARRMRTSETAVLGSETLIRMYPTSSRPSVSYSSMVPASASSR